CAAARTAELLDAYAKQVESAFEESQRLRNAYEKVHLLKLKQTVFALARGARPVSYAWIKEQATLLVREARQVWGSTEASQNPLMQEALALGMEGKRVRDERDKIPGWASTSCKGKKLSGATVDRESSGD